MWLSSYVVIVSAFYSNKSTEFPNLLTNDSKYSLLKAKSE